MRRWILVIAAGLVLGANACDDACGKKDKGAGGGASAFELAVHMRVHDDAAMDRNVLSRAFDVDPPILGAGDPKRPLDLLAGSVDSDVNAYALVVAASDARAKLAARYALQPILYRQERIQPRGEKARCMLLNEHIVCTSSPRIDKGVIRAQRFAQALPDAGASAVTVHIKSKAFGERLLPVIQARVARMLSERRAHQALRKLWTGTTWGSSGSLGDTTLVGRVVGHMLILEGTCSLGASPPPWLPLEKGALRVTATDGALAYGKAGSARRLRLGDGTDADVSQGAEAIEDGVFHATVDLTALLGGGGQAEVTLRLQDSRLAVKLRARLDALPLIVDALSGR